jgi:hypothetical protein
LINFFNQKIVNDSSVKKIEIEHKL